jgi:hypothetical protein
MTHNQDAAQSLPGPIVLLGSGETAANVQRVYTWLYRHFETPVNIAILETPAGFQPNAEAVAQDVADYIAKRLVNFSPQIELVAGRRRDSANAAASTDNPDVITPLWYADVLMAGPGSPTYAVRHLRDSLAWDLLRARNRLGAGLMFSSATTLAASTYTLPVYELYKVGEDLHWQPGLNLFADFGLSLLLVSHWNNNDGGATLDTSRCYIGQDRFTALLKLLPPDPARTLVGIDEKTALCLDFSASRAEVVGAGGVTLMRGGSERRFAHGAHFDLAELGNFRLPDGGASIPAARWQEALDRHAAHAEQSAPPDKTPAPDEVNALVAAREKARAARDWAAADALRAQIEAAGWRVTDTPDGSAVEKRV